MYILFTTMHLRIYIHIYTYIHSYQTQISQIRELTTLLTAFEVALKSTEKGLTTDSLHFASVHTQ